MRQNVIIALLAVIATLLAVAVFRPPQYVLGQMATGGTATVGEIAVATGGLQGGQGAAFYLYEPKDHKLLVYYLANNGLELRAARNLEWDLKADEFNQPPGKLTTINEIRIAVKKLQEKQAKQSKKADE